MPPESPPFGHTDGFKPPRARKKRNNRPPKELLPPAALLQRTTADLAETPWLEDCKRILQESLEAVNFQCPNVLCLGLGSPSSSRDARAQLAFLLAICEDLHIDRANVSVYDPVFTEQDAALLDALGIIRITEDRHARFRVHAPTVAFMPHCDLQLYENLLRENWAGAHAGSSNLVLIANRLSDYANSVPARKMSVEHPCVWRLAPYLCSRNLPLCPAYPTAFNNTAVQYSQQIQIQSQTAGTSAPLLNEDRGGIDGA